MTESSTSLELPDFGSLLQRVQSEQPDPADLQAFWVALRADPALHDHLGDMAAQARGYLARLADPSPVVQALLRHGMQNVIRSLDDPQATPLEKLLADNVGICWARFYIVEMSYTLRAQESCTIAQADYEERRLSHAQLRFVRALESLARVRRLLHPHAQPLQVNIAQAGSQQLNAHVPAALLSPQSPPPKKGRVQAGSRAQLPPAPAPSLAHPPQATPPKRFHKGRFA